MKWECAECGASEAHDKAAIDAVCHHCGKPLCHKHRVVVSDPAFHTSITTPRSAYHCAACKKRYHG